LPDGWTGFGDLPGGLFCRTRDVHIALAREAKQFADHGKVTMQWRQRGAAQRGIDWLVEARDTALKHCQE
jgi:hypothetical protein